MNTEGLGLCIPDHNFEMVHYPENLLQLWLQDFSPLMRRKEDVP